jgi:DNA-directed RNA polymerase II subunit RPB1
MQGTLNTFHFAGVGSMNGTLGMPRTEELMHCTQCISRPLTTFVWKGDVFDNGISMVGCKLGDIVDHATIVYSDVLHAAVPSRDRPWVALAQRLNMPKLITTKGWVMRVTLSPRKVFVRKLDYSAVLKVLMKHEEIAAVTFSPETHHEWVIRMAPASPTTTMCERLQTSIEKAHAGLRDGGVSADHVAHLAAELHARNTLSRLLKTLLIQGTASIREIGNIKKTKEMSAHQDAPCKEIVATAAGSCLYDLAAFPQVDWTRVVTNDVMDVYNRLGIDAAARVLFRELKKVLTPSGSGFDTRHISTLVHAMCRSGNVVRMDRHGINRSNISVYQAASFEEAIRQLTRASAAGLTNPASDISSCTITGGLGPVGTGFIEVLPYVSKNSALTISL